MSGPFDTSYVLEALIIAKIVELSAKALETHAEALAKRLEDERQGADLKAANAVAQLYGSALAQSRLDERRQVVIEQREQMLALRREKKQLSENAGGLDNSGPGTPSHDPLDDVDFEQAMNLVPEENGLALPIKHPEPITIVSTVSREQVTAAIAEMLQLKAGLAQDEFTQQFCAARGQQWATSVDEFLAALPTSTQPDLAFAQAHEFIAQAKTILKGAEEIQQKFAIRNHILAEMIASLQEIGFFVEDPQYEDATNPAGVVLVRARRGGETLEANVDLSETIRSVWDGIEDKEQCKSEFFRYVDEMKARGIELSSERPDLRERSELKEHSMKEVVRGGVRELHHG